MKRGKRELHNGEWWRRGRLGWAGSILGALSVACLTTGTAAHAQLSERPGSSTDTTLGAKDLTGKSVKDRRVRVVHTTEPGRQGGSRYLQDLDPWLAFQRGKNLTQREFTARDGAFGRTGSFFEPKLLGDRVTPRLGRDHVNSCGICHGVPFREAGAGGNIPKGAGTGRNTPHFFGAGVIEMIGLQTRLKVLQACDPAGRGFISKQDVPHDSIRIAPSPGATPVDYGWCWDHSGDGAPDLNKVFRVWYVDAEGRRVTSDDNGDGVINLRDSAVAGFNLEMMPFGWGETEGAMAPTLRVFFNDPIDTHTGMQAYDPTVEADDGSHGDERAGDGLAGLSNAGARQFAIHAPADRGLLVNDRGLSLDDPDGDGVINEVSEGDVDLAEWYMLNAPVPGVARQTAQTRRGRATFETLGCATCHVPDWRIEPASPDHHDPYRRYDGDRRFFTLAVTYREESARLEGALTLLADRVDGRWIPRRGAATVRGIFSDFKHHDMGPEFAETLFNGAQLARFRTAPLWGVGSSAPYGHDGASLTLDDVIRRHGGEAAESAARYRRAPPQDRDAVLAFLGSLVLFQSDQVPTDLDGDGRISQHFMVAGRDTGVERFNPEWLFARPCAIEGPVRAPDGSAITSFACMNKSDAYGESLEWLRDADDDGFPDVVDACPWDAGYGTGCPEAIPVAGPAAPAAPAGAVPSTVALAVDPRTPRIVWSAGADGWGVKKSLDAGRTWRLVTTDPRVAHATTVAVDPSESGVVYVGSPSGVFVTRDGGVVWELRTFGMTDTRVFALAVNPRSPHTVYAGGFGGRLYRSIDRGATWTESRIGSDVYRVTSLAVDGGDSSIPALDNRPTALYAATSGAGLFRSDDGGETWRALAGLSERVVYAIGLDPRVPTTIYIGTPAGVYRSLDRGGSWARAWSGSPVPVVCLAVDPERPTTVLAGTPGGVMSTLDGGRTWRHPDGVATADPVVSVVLDPWNPRAAYVATFGGRVVESTVR